MGQLARRACLMIACGLEVGCGASYFICADDTDCNGGVGGMCQPSGSCSFDDSSCPSGQRYGRHAPPNRAGECVPTSGDDAAGTDSDAAVATTTNDPSATSSSIDSMTGTTSGASSASVSVTDTASASMSVTSAEDGSSTMPPGDTEAPSACAALLDEEFDGAALGNAWWLSVSPDMDLGLAGGQLVFTFADAIAWGGIGTNAAFDVTNAELVLEVDHFTSDPYGTEINLALFDEDARIRIAVCCGSVYAQEIVADEKVTYAQVPWAEERYQRLRIEDSVVHYEISHDAVAWTSVAIEPAPFDLSHAYVSVSGGTWEIAANPGFASMESVRLCQLP